MRIFFIGDVMGRPGRRLVSEFLPKFRFERQVDFVVVNAENSAGGKGLTASAAKELYKAGADVLTGGNHTWRNKEILDFIGDDPRVLRPENYPAPDKVPGSGHGIFEVPGLDRRIGVVNLLGRVHMDPMECPFRVGRETVESLRLETPLVLVDFHAEITSEKIALGWHLDGLATAVLGTHTHVQTADETILPDGTAYQTDVGMTGPHDGVLGVRRDIILRGMTTRLPVRHALAKGDLRLCGTLVEADPETGRALSIERILLRKEEKNGRMGTG